MYLAQLVMAPNRPSILVGAKSIGPEIKEALPYFIKPVEQLGPKELYWEIQEIRPIGGVGNSDVDDLIEFSDLVGLEFTEWP